MGIRMQTFGGKDGVKTATVALPYDEELGIRMQTFGGKDGVKTATVALPYNEEVRFHFKSFKNSNDYEDFCFYEGQIPEIHFFIKRPK
ncbi:unnamed protein product [Gongylonema pulchrum]|uniref:PHR domain-containing protein n=1 Tax=Gongylonema pulchrum TaxID=637853 RepID=A0A3P7PZM4_9BILA|nr:unnamed protein product [Gongylonema pulchrum]